MPGQPEDEAVTPRAKSRAARTRESRPAGVAADVRVFGVVQGVGFRPFVYRLAAELGLRGGVRNAGEGVEIHLEAETKSAIDRFVRDLAERKPPLAAIETVRVDPAPFRGASRFEIEPTREGAAPAFVFISPDIATCPDCLAEIRDPSARRFRYPFTNCTNCGPRYTIVKSLPYDRAATTMAGFAMCEDCRREYEDPLDRRHHAQPIACPACGPRVTLRDARTGRVRAGGIDGAARLLLEGRIVAVKGLGGFHLMCDATRRDAVKRLRAVKERARKPFALMAADLGAAERVARVGPEERELLLSARRPIVLLEKARDLPGVAPGLREVGIMLAYTPLHHILLERVPLVVATSSNRRDAPIMKDEDEGEGVRRLCDAVLTHDRPIHTRADDSVVKAGPDRRPLLARRARGYVPYPQPVAPGLRADATVLAVGGELKVTVSLYRKGYVVTSQFLGDLDEYANYGYFEETVRNLLKLFGGRPDLVVSDLHPDFRSTRYAEAMGIPHLRVQHHHAHTLAPLLEHGVAAHGKVLGIAFDGYGYGEDGTAWGGEFLIADYLRSQRYAHARAVALPGGDAAARQPWRMALSYLRDAFAAGPPPRLAAFAAVPAEMRNAVSRLIASGRGVPVTSSVGRLFDAVSFLCGLAPAEMEYEAEAAIKLEDAVDPAVTAEYPYDMDVERFPMEVSFAPLVRAVVKDVGKGAPAAKIAAKFHNTLAAAAARVAAKARRDHGIRTAVLSGGVFLNRVLLGRLTARLEAEGFRVLRSVQYSPNDESLSVGQVAHGLARLRAGK